MHESNVLKLSFVRLQVIELRERMVEMVHLLQDRICEAISDIDETNYREDEWTREEGGGGRSRVFSEGKVFEKAGVTYTATTTAGIDVEVSNSIEKEIMNELKVARLFREIQVNSGATVLPIQPDSDKAEWAAGATQGAISLQNKGGSGNNFASAQKILNAYRLISITAIDNLSLIHI